MFRAQSASRPFLASLQADDAAEVQSLARRVSFASGEVLLHQGDPGDRAVLLLHGRVKLVAIAPGGREVLLGLAGPGDLLGELAAIDQGARTATVIALEDVDAGIIPARELRTFLGERPSAALTFAAMLARRLRAADGARVELSTHDSLGRVALRLLELAERYGEPVDVGVRIELPLTQEELACWVGASIESVARALRLMRSLGWVATSRRAITVLDIEALRARRAMPAAV